VKAVCDALPYKGAMEFSEDYVAPVFVFDNPEDCPESLQAAMGDFYTELCDLKSKLDAEEDRQAEETVEEEVEEVEVVDGKAVVKKVTKKKTVKAFDEIPCVDENGDGICDVCNTTHSKFPIEKPKTYKVPRMIKGTPMPEQDKARLAELIGG